MPERIYGNLADIFARLGSEARLRNDGDRYFQLTDDIRTPTTEIARRVAAFAAANPQDAAPRRDAGTDARITPIADSLPERNP